MIIPEWFNDIHFAFSRHNDGQMSFKRAEPDIVVKNRIKFFNGNNLNLDSVVASEIIHNKRIALVSQNDVGRGARERNWIPEIDGLVTSTVGLLLLTTHADCAPIVIYPDFDTSLKIYTERVLFLRDLAFCI
ncbi:MAG: laccase domain-containing protein [Candidatus Hatepunaea meridiana]|nr:laccase domain-containing protein [Candidatus Hatepunaea meridiana]